MKVSINIPDDMYNDIKCGYTCQEYADDIMKIISEISNDSDNLTNGDVIKAMFPNLEIFEESPSKIVWGRSQSETKWWNSPYRNELNIKM